MELSEHLKDEEGGEDAMWPPQVALVTGFGTAVLLIIVIAMCVCRKRNKAHTEAVDLEMTPIANGSVGDRKSKATSVEVDMQTSTEIEVFNLNSTGNRHSGGGRSSSGARSSTGNRSSNRHSNGSVVKDQAESGRPKSHDQRALPDIPAVSTNSVSQTEDEEEDEGLYDIIHKSKTRDDKPAKAVPQSDSQNLYEKVDNDLDPTYEGVKDDGSDLTTTSSRNPYATVNGIGHADYARIEDRKGPSSNRDVTRVQGLAPQASIETLDGTSYSSITTAPPVPDKHFDSDDGLAAASVSPLLGNSPSLPPRNGTSHHVEVDGSEEDGALIATSQNGASIVMVTMDEMDIPLSAPPKKKEPPYSSVTARESLANLRQRQAEELGLVMPPSPPANSRPLRNGGGASGPDVMYESVNYDEIRSSMNAEATSPAQPAADRQSLTSDLYAEIGSDSGDNSTRSSMYVRVADIRRENHAPTPPPVDFLKNIAAQASAPEGITPFGRPGAEDAADPHYASVNPRGRPRSDIYSAASHPTGMAASNHGNDPGAAVYAVVDKGRQNRMTVHSDNPEQLYAEVNKPNRRPPDYFGNAAANGFAANGFANTGFAGTGARPKVKGDNGDAAENKNDPGYQTIGSVGSEDPDYDNIPDTIPESKSSDLGSDYDPNYERVRDNGASGRLAPGVATEIRPETNSHGMVNMESHRVNSDFWNRREHVYQEITETQRQKMLLETESEQHPDRFSTAL